MKNALISVYDKTGIVDFSLYLNRKGWNLYASAGTYRHLKEHGVKVESIEELTGFKQTEDGRVKTLHPLIFKAILGTGNEGFDIYFDMVVVNLYPFIERYSDFTSIEEMVELIDIGGVSLLRAAAKNWKRVLVVSDPSQYDYVKEKLEHQEGFDDSMRKGFAARVFSYTSYYDSLIFHKFNLETEFLPLGLSLGFNLKYGENPEQRARFYTSPLFNSKFELIKGKSLSYNNLLDLDGAMGTIKEFDQPAAAIIKHSTPCGVGMDTDILKAYEKAFEADSLSAYGGILIINRTLNPEIALLIKKHFYELVAAPDIEEEAIKILSSKKRLRIVKYLNGDTEFTVRSTCFGLLYQESPGGEVKEWKVVTERVPTEQEWEAMRFGWKVVKWVKSNGIVVATTDRTLGISGGQTARIFAAREALRRAESFNFSPRILASDGFLPFDDVVREAYKMGVTAVVQPGGSIRDGDSIDFCNRNNMSMVFTGQRCFRH